MQRITTCLAFDNRAEEAVQFYKSVFSDCKITAITHCGPNEFGGTAGSVRTVSFQLFGQEFLAVNGGPHFRFTDGISIVVNCETQKEIDLYWEKLSAGGKKNVCGWLQDKFGVSWQVVPQALSKMMADPDENKSQRVMQAILKMDKLDLETLKNAYEQK